MTPLANPADESTAECLFACGRPVLQWHHLTGRGRTGFYLDPDLVVPLCHRHHVLVHHDLRQQHVDFPPTDLLWNREAETAFRLSRLAPFFARWADYSDHTFLRPLAAAIATDADRIYTHLHNPYG
jgi:hypothetical protein